MKIPAPPIRLILLTTVGLLTAVWPLVAFGQEEPRTTFDDHAKAVLRQRCAACHNPNKKSGDLDVTNYTSLMMGGSSGSVIEPGDVSVSYLFSLITHEDEPVMPPDGRIPDAEIDVIRKWIEAGAPENAGSKVTIRKPAAMSVTADPLARPEMVADWPRLAMEPVQHTARNPVVRSIATSPWVPVAAVAGRNQVVLYDTESLQIRGMLPFPEGTVNVLKFSRNGAILLAAGGQQGASGVAVLWDVTTGERIGVFGDELDAVRAADISPDHSRIALGGPQRVVNVYSTSTGEREYQLTKHTEWVTALEFSVDGVLLASGDRNGGLYVFEAFTGREYLTLKGHEQTVNDITWRSDSNVVASACDDATIRLWEMNNGSQVRSWNAHGGGATSLEFLRDGRLISTGDDRTTRLWQADGNKVLDFPAFPEIGLAVSWCNETGRAIAADHTGVVQVWNGADAAPLAQWTPNPEMIGDRIARATAQVSQFQSELEPLTVELTNAVNAANAARQVLDTANQELAMAQQSFEQLQASMAAAEEKQAQARSQMATMQTSLESQSSARSLVTESLAKLKQAVQGLPEDPVLLDQVSVLTSRITGFDTTIGELETQMASVRQAAEESGSQVNETNQKMAAQQAVLDSATATVRQATAQWQPLVARRDELSARNASLESSLQTAKQELQRWQGEQAFLAQLTALRQRMAEVVEVAAREQERMDAANKTLAEAQSAADAVQADMTRANQAIEQVQAEIDAARTINQ